MGGKAESLARLGTSSFPTRRDVHGKATVNVLLARKSLIKNKAANDKGSIKSDLGYLNVKLILLPVSVLQLEDGLADGTGQRSFHVRLNVKFETLNLVALNKREKLLQLS